jgi:hypothetical protein
VKTDKSTESCACLQTAPGYLLNELSPDEKRAFEAHLEQCPICRNGVDAFQSVIQEMRQIPTETCRHDLADSVLARLPANAWTPAPVSLWRRAPLPLLARIAALLFALIAIGVLATLLLRMGKEGSHAPQETIARSDASHPTSSPVAALENAKRWLQKAQASDGGWAAGQSKDHSIGVSSLALLAFMDGNPDVFRGPYAATVRQGIDNLVARQNERGLVGPEVSTAPYNHGLATLAILDACALEKNAAWQAAGVKALKFICATQLSSGGWGYLEATAGPANTSASIWPIQALLRADDLGYPGLRPNIDRGLAWLQSAVSQDGLMGYTKADDCRYGQDTMTAAGIVCFLKDNKGSQRPTVKALLPALHRIVARQDSKTDFYRLFFIAKAVGLANSDQSPAALTAITQKLASLQNAGGPRAGSWDANDPWGSVGGPVYSTAMAMLALRCN